MNPLEYKRIAEKYLGSVSISTLLTISGMIAAAIYGGVVYVQSQVTPLAVQSATMQSETDKNTATISAVVENQTEMKAEIDGIYQAVLNKKYILTK